MIKKQTTKKLYFLGIAIILLDLSLMYINQAGLLGFNRTLLPQFFVSVIFGFIHGSRKFFYIKQTDKKCSVIDILFTTILYTAWYNVILLPVSGLGILEWIFVAFILFSDFICSISTKTDQKLLYFADDNNLIYLGTLLALIKQITFYLFPENIYVESFAGNGFARFLVLAFSILGLVFLISSLFKVMKIDLKAKVNKTGKSKISFNKVKKQIRLYFQSFLSLFSGPTVIIIVLSVISVLMIVVMVFIKSLSDDILKFVENLLLKFLSTGKITIVPSIIYYILQIVVVISVLIIDKLCLDLSSNSNI